jgi:hypothetical protein
MRAERSSVPPVVYPVYILGILWPGKGGNHVTPES